MAEKHKSKYKAPKDLEKSQKTNARKDLKDYTVDDKDGKLNPKSTKEKQLNVLRKTDKPMQDDGKMYPTYNADDRLYKDLEDATYEPKDAAKKMKKRQDNEEKETADVLKDKIENLTREQKERLVREYVRRKIVKILKEQAETEETPEAPVEDPTALPAPEPDAAGVEADPNATPPAPEAGTETAPEAGTEPTAAPTPDATAAAAPVAGAVAATAAAPGTEETPAADASAEQGPEERQSLNVSKITDILSKERSNLSRVETLFNSIDKTFKDADSSDTKNFYRLMLRTIAKKYKKLDSKTEE